MSSAPLQIAGIGAVLALAGFVQGLTGFGFAIVGMAFLPMITPDWKATVTLVAVNSILIPFVLLKKHGGGFSVRPAMGLTVGNLVGTYLGFHFMNQHLNGSWFIRMFGAVLVIFSIFDLAQTLRKDSGYSIHRTLAIPFGLAGGFFGGAFNIGGPPVVAYAYSQGWSKSQIISTLQVVFLCGAGYRMLLMGSHGFFSRQMFDLLLWTTPPTLGGLLLGNHFLAIADQSKLRMGVFALVGILGIKYAFFPG
jgi:hypothetical protein